MYKIDVSGAFVLDLEATFSMKKVCKEGLEVEQSDKATPFNLNNRVTEIGVFIPQSGRYDSYLLEQGEDIVALRELVAESKRIIGHNVKYDVHWLNKLGIDTSHLIQDDTLVREYVLRGGRDKFGMLGLDTVAPIYGGTNKLRVMKDMWNRGLNTNEIPQFIRTEYLEYDVWNTWTTWLGQEHHPNRQRFDRILRFKSHLNGAVQRMEYNGIYVNEAKAFEIKRNFEAMSQEAELHLFDMIDNNLTSAKIEWMPLPDDKQAAKTIKELAKKEGKITIGAGSPKEMSKLMYGLTLLEADDFYDAVVEEKSVPRPVDENRIISIMTALESAKTEKQKDNAQERLSKYNTAMDARHIKHIKEECKERAKQNKALWKSSVKGIKTQSDLNALLKRCMKKVGYGFGVKPFPHRDILGADGLSAGGKAQVALLSKKQSKKAQQFMDALSESNKFKQWINLCINAIIYNRSDDGCVHAGFNVAGTISGRFSSSKPNMQNLPSPKKHGGLNNVRECVESRWGDEGLVVAIDYSQLELRYVMGLVDCLQGIKDYMDGVDMHAATARSVYDAEHGEGAFDKLSEKDYAFWRGEAKAVNFGLLYGAHPKTPLEEKLQEAFFSRYPEVAKWQEKVEAEILRYGEYVSPMTGWAYNFEGANRQNFWKGYTSEGKGWRNRSKNIPIQGGGNEIIQAASIVIDKKLREAEWGDGCLMIAQVHDELVFDCKKKYLDNLLELSYKWMESTDEIYNHYFGTKIGVPMVVEAQAGENWYNQKDIDR